MAIRSVALSTLAALAMLSACGGSQSTASQSSPRAARLTVASGNDTLVTGLGGAAGYGETDLKANTSSFTAPVTAFTGDLDDGLWTVDLSSLFPDGILFGGQKLTATAYVGTNGYVTLGHPTQLWALDKVQDAPVPLIAAFLADADLRASGNVYLDVDTTASDPVATVTWVDVPPFVLSGTPTKTNAFQLRLHRLSTDATAGDKVAVELRYARLDWTTADSMSDLQGVGGWSDGNPTSGFVSAGLFPAKAYTTDQVTDPNSLTWGTLFTTSTAGKVLGIRYYADATQSGTLTAAAFSGDTAQTASVLAQKTATAAGSAGWHTILFDAPVSVASGTTYTAALFTPSPVAVRAVRHYFDSAVDSAPLHMPAAAGVYAYGSALTFPSTSFANSSYLIDAIFQAGTPDTVYAEISGSGTTSVGKNATADATATNLVPAQPGVYLFGAEGVATALAASSDSTPQSATVNAAFAKPLTVALKDAYGNAVATSGVTVTFAAPSSGASAVLSAASAVTDAQGVASVTATANGTAGAYAVVATAGALTASFQLTNAADTSSGGGDTGGTGGTGSGGTGEPGSGKVGGGSGGCGTGGDVPAGLLLPAFSALALRLRRRR